VRDGLAGHSSSAIVLDQVDVTLVGVMAWLASAVIAMRHFG